MALFVEHFQFSFPIFLVVVTKDRLRHYLCSSFSHLPFLLYFKLDCLQFLLLGLFMLSQSGITVNNHPTAGQIRLCQLFVISDGFLFLSKLGSHLLIKCEVIFERILEFNKLLECRLLCIEGIDVVVRFLKCCKGIFLLVHTGHDRF